MYVLTRPGGVSADEWAETLRTDASTALAQAGALGVVVNVADSDVEPAAAHRIVARDSPIDAVVQVWVHTANDPERAPVDAVLAEVSASADVRLVTESRALADTRGTAVGDRTPGFSQMAFVTRRPEMDIEAFRKIWLCDHTRVAIDAQETHLYLQNAVARTVGEPGPAWDAIVEEAFTAEAMTDPHAFFDSGGDDEVLAANQQAIFSSVERFIDLSVIEVVPTSRYVTVNRLAAGAL